MSRKMRRSGQALTEEECKTLLKTGKRAVLSLNGDDGYPYGVPLNFYYEEAENTLYFHGAKEGYKIDAVKKNGKACVTLWEETFRDEGDWAWHVISVIAEGRAKIVEDKTVIAEKVRKLGLKYYPTAEAVEKEMAAVDRVGLIAVTIEHISGKRIHEK